MSAKPLFNHRRNPAYTGVVEAKGTQKGGMSVKLLSNRRTQPYRCSRSQGNTGRRPCRQKLYSTGEPNHTGVVEAKEHRKKAMSAKPLFNLREPSLYRCGGRQRNTGRRPCRRSPVQPENPTYQVTEGTVTETETVILPYETEYVTDANVTPMRKPSSERRGW